MKLYLDSELVSETCHSCNGSEVVDGFRFPEFFPPQHPGNNVLRQCPDCEGQPLMNRGRKKFLL